MGMGGQVERRVSRAGLGQWALPTRRLRWGCLAGTGIGPQDCWLHTFFSIKNCFNPKNSPSLTASEKGGGVFMIQLLSSHCFSASSNSLALSMLGDGGNGAMSWPREWPLALSPHQGESYRGTGKEWINFSPSLPTSSTRQLPLPQPHTLWALPSLPGSLGLASPVQRRVPSIQHPPGAPEFT